METVEVESAKIATSHRLYTKPILRVFLVKQTATAVAQLRHCLYSSSKTKEEIKKPDLMWT